MVSLLAAANRRTPLDRPTPLQYAVMFLLVAAICIGTVSTIGSTVLAALGR